LFHVKRRRELLTASGLRIIGAAVRDRVVQRLAKFGYTPAEPEKFPERVAKFAENLALWGATTSLTARPDDPAEIAFHVIDSLMPAVIAAGPERALLTGAFAAGRKVLDVGSGAGFPGLILAAATRASFTLAESRRKRASFLSVAAAEMGLVNVTIETAHVTPSRRAPQFDVVTARAVGITGSFYALASAALRPAGLAILYASPSQRLGLDAASAAGLSEYARHPYAVERDGAMVERVLAIWRKR
jgi:16S rRNA (guanine(527)-N(7))-methyltransferase RsmG